MAHFAEIDENSVVLRVLVVADSDCLDEMGVESEEVGASFLNRIFGGTWVQTSYTSRIRKRYATAGCTYNSELDMFIWPKPGDNYELNADGDWVEVP